MKGQSNIRCAECGRFNSVGDRCARCIKSNPMNRLYENSIPIPESGCLIWLGGIDRSGYGFLSIGGRKTKAHRLAWEVAYGKIPEGLCVCHHCDVPLCVRPDHLFLGSHRENMSDLAKKGYLKKRMFSSEHRMKLSTAMIGNRNHLGN